MPALAASGIAVGMTRFGGGAAFLWVANAILLASLITVPRREWPVIVVTSWLAGAVTTSLWGLGWQVAPVLSIVNAAKSVLGAFLVTRWGIHRSGMDSARNLGLFILAVGIIAPALTGVFGALVIGVVSHTSFSHNFGHWYVGHALGALTFTPIFVQVASGEVRRWLSAATVKQAGEAVLLLLLVAVVAALVFAQSQLPLLFLPVLPLMLVTFRVGRVGSSFAVVVITAVGAGLTLSGRGPVNLIHAGLGERLQFLQLYLAVTVLTVLPVAADLARRHKLFERLRDSEARFRLLTENSTDIVLNLDVNGIIRYASPSITLLGGYEPERLVGTASAALVHPDDRDRVTAVHLDALRHPKQTFSVEYRGLVLGLEQRWFETHTRAVTDDRGVVRGVVSAVRDTSTRRRNEAELSRAANTDALTGICNRRAFDRDLAHRLSSEGAGEPGCVALFDLDHFKRVNDTFGHAMGDAVLKAFARRAEQEVRAADMLARIGGKEFGLIFSGLLIDQAHIVCERIRDAIASDTLTVGEWPVRITVSVGITAFRAGEDAHNVTRKADEALYIAKQQGRNRSSLAA